MSNNINKSEQFLRKNAMKYPITLDALEVLDAIDRKGSFAAAANELYRVPSAISYSVQKLEQDLEVTLFRKEGRKARLTPAGQVLLEQGREILQAAERLASTTKKTHSGWEPMLNIAIDSILNFDFIYPLITQFYAIQPDIEINLYEEVMVGAYEALLSNRVDLVIGVGLDSISGGGIKYMHIQQVEWLFAVTPGHVLTQSPMPLTKQLIGQHRFVVVRDSSRDLAPQSYRVFNQRALLRVPTMAEKIRAQCLGLGIGFLPAHRIQRELENGHLVVLPVEHMIAQDALYMAWKANNKGKALHWFIEQLSAQNFS